MRRKTNVELVAELNKLNSYLMKDSNEHLTELLGRAQAENEWKAQVIRDLLEILKNGAKEGKFPRQ